MSERAELERRWLELTRDTMPRLAKERGWPVIADHCFQRILLDNACDGVWYEKIKGRPGYRAAPDNVLATAIRLGEDAVSGATDLDTLNRRSLAWRGKQHP
jgi:hypothetical protein